MKRLVSVILALMAISPVAINGQTRARRAAEDFPSFWLRFKGAVAAGDKDAVASITRFPLEGMDKAEFIGEFDAIFDKSVRRRFRDTKPVKDGRYYELSCGPEAVFMFESVKGEYKLVLIGVKD
jgi:hypothetical protein